MAGMPTWAWIIFTGMLTITIRAFAHVLLTWMKLAFAREVLRPGVQRANPPDARNDLDAARRFIAPSTWSDETPGHRLRPSKSPRIRALPPNNGSGDAAGGTSAA